VKYVYSGGKLFASRIVKPQDNGEYVSVLNELDFHVMECDGEDRLFCASRG
jgi:hypothetical protein